MCPPRSHKAPRMADKRTAGKSVAARPDQRDDCREGEDKVDCGDEGDREDEEDQGGEVDREDEWGGLGNIVVVAQPRLAH